MLTIDGQIITKGVKVSYQGKTYETTGEFRGPVPYEQFMNLDGRHVTSRNYFDDSPRIILRELAPPYIFPAWMPEGWKLLHTYNGREGWFLENPPDRSIRHECVDITPLVWTRPTPEQYGTGPLIVRH